MQCFRKEVNVIPLSIADQINVHAVTHQELQYAVLQKRGKFHSSQHSRPDQCPGGHSPAGAPVCSASEDR
jgi:hypothetical protein